jgi:hypothetical protein
MLFASSQKVGDGVDRFRFSEDEDDILGRLVRAVDCDMDSVLEEDFSDEHDIIIDECFGFEFDVDLDLEDTMTWTCTMALLSDLKFFLVHFLSSWHNNMAGVDVLFPGDE